MTVKVLRTGPISLPSEQRIEASQSNRSVIQRQTFTRAAKKHAAAAHVPAPDKVGRKEQALPKNFKQRLQVFRSGDTSQKNDNSLGRQQAVELLSVAHQWIAVFRIVRMHLRICHGAQPV